MLRAIMSSAPIYSSLVNFSLVIEFHFWAALSDSSMVLQSAPFADQLWDISITE